MWRAAAVGQGIGGYGLNDNPRPNAAVLSPQAHTYGVPMTTITGTPGSESLVGTAGADDIRGFGGADILAGGGGNDLLYGMSGSDELWGGAGADKFAFRLDGSIDAIPDFNAAEGDFLLLLSAADGSVVDGGGGVLSWNAESNVLAWDPDMGGAAGATAFAVTDGAIDLSRESFAAGFEPAVVRVTSGALTENTVFDWGDASFDAAQSTYVGAELAAYDVRYDSGALSSAAFDYADAAAWGRTTAEYDASGELFAYTVDYDSEATAAWRFDTNDDREWARVLEEYDAQGRLFHQAALLDDGSAWERYVDVDDSQPWAYSIENYAGGSLQSQTYYNADGSVFA